MKKISLLLISLLLFTVGASAQDVLDKVSDLTCECIEKKVEKNMASDKLTMVLGLCMLESSSSYKKEIKKKYKIDLTDQNEFSKLGELLGERMATRCDKFMEIVFTMVGDEDSEIGNEIKKELYDEIGEEDADLIIDANTSEKSTKAEILDVKEGNILIFKCKVDGKLVDVYCIESFKGAEVLKDAQSMKNKMVTISTREKTIYSPELKSFITIEELTKIQLVE